MATIFLLAGAWLLKISENQDNPHLPTIHREDIITLPCGLRVRCYVVERLADFTDDGSRPTHPQHFHDHDFGLLWRSLKTMMLSFGDDNSNFAREVKSLDVFVEKIKDSSCAVARRTDNDISATVDDNIIESHEAFLETLFAVLTQLSTEGSMDLHGGNFMLRGDTVVITDPIAHKYTG